MKFYLLLQEANVAKIHAQRVPELEQQIEGLRTDLNQSNQDKTALSVELQQERQQAAEKNSLLEKVEEKFSNTFKALSADALSMNNRSFLELANSTLAKFQEGAKTDLTAREKAITQLLAPVNETLGQVNHKLQDLEKTRVSAYDVLRHQVKDLISSQKELRSETANLVNALKTPNVRGRWGEMQLKRVVEITGLSAHCDFVEQAQLADDEKIFRPDMIVKLPGNKCIIVDAKAPLSAYLKAIEPTDEQERNQHLKDHARQVRAHIQALSSRAYWSKMSLTASPEFVVLFLPGETFFTAALEQDPTLIEASIEKKVILTTPSTLIALLHAVAYGWRQENLSANAQEVIKLGQTLYKRIAGLGKHVQKLGRDLGSVVRTYNETIGSLEQRVLPGARKFKNLESASDSSTIEGFTPIDLAPREVTAKELKFDETQEITHQKEAS